MAKGRKRTIQMVVTVTIPGWMTAAQARREVRSLINNGVGYLEYGPDFQDATVRAKAVGPVSK
jgi:hypothetical protein